MLGQEIHEIACPRIIEIKKLQDKEAALSKNLEPCAHGRQQQGKNRLFL